jgi:hypothetical protein
VTGPETSDAINNHLKTANPQKQMKQPQEREFSAPFFLLGNYLVISSALDLAEFDRHDATCVGSGHAVELLVHVNAVVVGPAAPSCSIYDLMNEHVVWASGLDYICQLYSIFET